jgi:c-di-GMP-binding flagellar brake protein YcgR
LKSEGENMLATTVAERRRYERVPFFADVAVRMVQGGPSLPARTIDLSLGGVGLVTVAALVPGTDVIIIFSIPDAAGKRTTDVVGRVVSLSADSDANRVGIEFLEPLSKSRTPELLRRLQQI